MKKLEVGIIGATGYVGVELLRLLLNHPYVNIVSLGSSSQNGSEIDDIYGNFSGHCNMKLESAEDTIAKSELLFLALPHGLSEEIADKVLKKGKKVIDLGADFRLEREEDYEKWYGSRFKAKELHGDAVYGLPEINRNLIKKTPIIANPGCYPTSIALPLIPLLEMGHIEKEDIIIDSKSGITGAGRGLSLTSHFPECNEGFNAYNIGKHRHIPEIEQTLSNACGDKITITFTPHLLPINRGILSTIYCKPKKDISLKDIHESLIEFYSKEKFVKILKLGQYASIKNVKYTNCCHISVHADERSGKIIICSTIDNMVKGAAGQAIQNMNIMMGLNEDEGLKLIAPAF